MKTRDERQYRYELRLNGDAFTIAMTSLNPQNLTEADIKRKCPTLSEDEVSYVLARAKYDARCSSDPSFCELPPEAPIYNDNKND